MIIPIKAAALLTVLIDILLFYQRLLLALAQLAEQVPLKPKVAGSIPPTANNEIPHKMWDYCFPDGQLSYTLFLILNFYLTLIFLRNIFNLKIVLTTT